MCQRELAASEVRYKNRRQNFNSGTIFCCSCWHFTKVVLSHFRLADRKNSRGYHRPGSLSFSYDAVL